MVYEPLHHKYRPKTFADLVGQEAIATTLTNAIRQQRIAPAYLFTGPRGTGKTSSARILAKSLNCQHQSTPTESPCGVCEACTSIALGSALDVIEIDAASNTGVDNIRDLIEKAQFAPVQCRYKVYVIDECLTGDSLVQTHDGLIRIDNPELKGKEVLSYNEDQKNWEYKKVLRWLDKGERSTLMIKTDNCEIRCTGNHLLRTETGWIEAKNVREGMKILSPVHVDVEPLFTNGEQMEKSEDLLEDINFMEMPMAKNPITWMSSWSKQKLFNLSVLVGAEKNWMFPNFFNKKVGDFKVFKVIGKNTLTEKDTEFGRKEPKFFWLSPKFCQMINLGLSMELYSEMVPLPILTKIVDFPDWLGHMETSKKNGWNTKPLNYQSYGLNYKLPPIKGMESYPSVVIPLVIPNSKKSLKLLSQTTTKKSFPLTGLIELIQKDLPGGIWMMEHLLLADKEAQELTFVLKDTPVKKIKSLPIGSLQRDILPVCNPIQSQNQVNVTTGSHWVLTLQENGSQTLNSIQSHQWNTSLETVVSVQAGATTKVYDLEVEDNHNFVANGLLVHNCHMLSTAAFNALLKTLEEPPDRVVFVLATTDPQRVLPTIISRCQRFDFRRIPLDSMIRHLSTIAAKETIDIVNPAITLVAQLAQGGLRDAESLLDQLSLLPPPVTPEAVWDLVGAVPERDLLALVQAIVADAPEALLDRARELMNRGREPLIVLQHLASFYRDLLIAKTAPQRGDMVAITEETWQEMVVLAKSLPLGTLLQGQQALRSSESQLKNTTQPRLWLEVTLLGLLPSALAAPSHAPSQTANVLSGMIPPALPAPATQPLFVQTQALPQAVPQQVSPGPVDSVNPNNTNVLDTSDTTPIASSPVGSPSIGSAPQVSSISPAEQDCASLWERTLARTRTASAKGLFSQQAQLVHFSGTQAIVVVRPKLMKLAETKLAPIQEAMSQVVGHNVTIRLQPSETIAPEPTASQATPVIPPPPVYQTPPPSTAPPSIPIPPSIPQTPLPPPPIEPSPPSSYSSTPHSLPTPAPVITPPLTTPVVQVMPPKPITPLDQVWNEDEALRVAKNVAQFFNGEVVSESETIAEADLSVGEEDNTPF